MSQYRDILYYIYITMFYIDKNEEYEFHIFYIKDY